METFENIHKNKKSENIIEINPNANLKQDLDNLEFLVNERIESNIGLIDLYDHFERIRRRLTLNNEGGDIKDSFISLDKKARLHQDLIDENKDKKYLVEDDEEYDGKYNSKEEDDDSGVIEIIPFRNN